MDHIIRSTLMGAGLAMDAFTVSVADALADPGMRRRKKLAVAGIFALFQAVMPLFGWFCVHTVLNYFSALERFIPWISFALLGLIGFNMIQDGIRMQKEDASTKEITPSVLILQAIATSIDALSVGFTIADYFLPQALLCVFIIAAVTFVICFAGICLGAKFGDKLSDKAQMVGGGILIIIAVELLLKGIL